MTDRSHTVILESRFVGRSLIFQVRDETRVLLQLRFVLVGDKRWKHHHLFSGTSSSKWTMEQKRQAHEVLPIISWCSVTNVARRKEVQFQTNCFCILLSPACTRFFLEHNYHLEAAERAKKQKTPRSTMNQNPACYNFQWHVLFPRYSGTFRGTALITMFYSSNICMLLQQPVKLHKWEGGNKRKMKKDDRTARCSLFICSVTCRDCLDSHHHQAAACRSTLLIRTKHDGENNHQ